MIRRLDANEDWVFGSGNGAYIGGLEGLALRIRTQLREWAGDCFFALQRGISWHMADRNEQMLIREICAAILRNPEVLGIKSIAIERAADRAWKPKITIATIYGEANI